MTLRLLSPHITCRDPGDRRRDWHRPGRDGCIFSDRTLVDGSPALTRMAERYEQIEVTTARALRRNRPRSGPPQSTAIASARKRCM